MSICLNTDAVIIYTGTNNLSYGDSLNDIIKQNKHIAEIIQQINLDCHIPIFYLGKITNCHSLATKSQIISRKRY